MEHINQLTTALPPKSSEHMKNSKQSKLEQPSGLSTELVKKLWLRMAKVYGHKWTSSYGQVDDGTWAKGLAGITPQQLADGLETCVTKSLPWPPSLPEFRGFCLGVNGNLSAEDEAIEAQQRRMRAGTGTALPKLWDNSEQAQDTGRKALNDLLANW